MTKEEFRRKMMGEYHLEKAEDEFVSACFLLQYEFKLTPDEVLNIKATQFDIMIEEAGKLSKRNADAAKKNKIGK